MGGRGSALNVVAQYGAKYGVRMNQAQYKEAVSSEANFVFRELEQSEPVQIIIKRAFKNGVLVAQVASDGENILSRRGLTEVAIRDLDNLVVKINNNLTNAKKEEYSSGSWSAFDAARARVQANNQIKSQLMDALKRLRKKR